MAPSTADGVPKCFQGIEAPITLLYTYVCMLFNKPKAIIQRIETDIRHKIQGLFTRLFALCEWNLNFNFTVNA